MKNCLITGFGRSGTSLMGGILHSNGYYLGDNLYPPRPSNPKGLFENDLINGINESILQRFDYSKISDNYPRFNKPYSPYNPAYGHRWLTYIYKDTTISCNNLNVKDKIIEAIKKTPFAYKDPRFIYTLGIWNNFINKDTIIICIFRQPDVVVDSVMIECNYADYLSNFYINEEIAYTIWHNSYSYLLDKFYHRMKNQIHFFNYEQLLNREAKESLSLLLDINLDFSFADSSLNRSKIRSTMPDYVLSLYNKLCKLATFNPAKNS